MWIFGGSKKVDEEIISEEADRYFEENFSPLLTQTQEQEIRDKIIKKYTEMRHKGFSKPEDNNSLLRYIPSMIGIGLGVNTLGVEILSELENLKAKKIEQDITTIEKQLNDHIKTKLPDKCKEICDQLDMEPTTFNILLKIGFEEKIKLILKKEAYELQENININQSYCQIEKSKISISIEEIKEFKKEAEEYFNKKLKNLVSFDGTFQEDSVEFIEFKNKIISNYIMMRLDGFYIDIDSFFQNQYKNEISKLINELIDRNAQKESESILGEKINQFKKRYEKRWKSINTDLSLDDFIKKRIDASTKIDAYRKMKEKNYNWNYCKHQITALKRDAHIYGGTDELEEEIKLYIVLSEKINKVKDNFNKENHGKGLKPLEYVSSFDTMSIDEKFHQIHEILKTKKDKSEFDSACSDLLFSKKSFSEYDKKYISVKDRKAIKRTIKLESSWISKALQIPENLEETAHELQIWIEWLNLYDNQLSIIYRVFGGKFLNFLLNKVIYPYFGFWNAFVNNFIYSWWILASKLFKKEDSALLKILKLATTSMSMLITFGGLLALSIFMPPLIPFTFIAAAWLLPHAGIWAGQGITALHERYDLFKYGYRDWARFSVSGDLKTLLHTNKSIEGLDDIAQLGSAIGKELERCQQNIDRVKKAIEKNPEGRPKDLSWIGGPIAYKAQELEKIKNEEEEITVEGRQVKLKKWNLKKLLGKWVSWFLPHSPDAAGKKILSYTEVFMGVSPEHQAMRNEVNQLKIELDRLEKTKVILNNAWDKITSKEADESDDDYAKRIIGISADLHEYIADLYIHNDNIKFTTKGLNASGVGSFYEAFEKFDVSRSKKAHEHEPLKQDDTITLRFSNQASLKDQAPGQRFTSTPKEPTDPKPRT